MDPSFIERIQHLVDKAGGQSALARRAGLSLGAIQRYLKGGDPTRGALLKLVAAGGVTLNWLVYGGEQGTPSAASSGGAMRVYGFSDTPQQGWYGEVDYKITAALDWPDPDVFAVVAPDRSLKSFGIEKGHVCIVSPNTKPQKGDVVFIRRGDGTAALKIYQSEDDKWLYVTGAIDPGVEGEPVSSAEQIRRTAVRQLAAVVFVRRRS